MHVRYEELCGPVVSAVDSGARGLGSRPGRVIALCSWARRFTPTVPLSPQEFKQLPVNCQGNPMKCGGGGVTLGWTAFYVWGISNTPSRFLLQGNRNILPRVDQ